MGRQKQLDISAPHNRISVPFGLKVLGRREHGNVIRKN